MTSKLKTLLNEVNGFNSLTKMEQAKLKEAYYALEGFDYFIEQLNNAGQTLPEFKDMGKKIEKIYKEFNKVTAPLSKHL